MLSYLAGQLEMLVGNHDYFAPLLEQIDLNTVQETRAEFPRPDLFTQKCARMVLNRERQCLCRFIPTYL